MSLYAEAGVNLELGDRLKAGLKDKLRKATRPEVLGGIGAFGGLFALDFKKYREPVLVASTDGVGTKLRVAVMAGRHGTVGQDLVNHSCNDIAVMGAEPLFFMDYIGTGRLEPKVFDEVIQGLAEACAQANVALLGGETAQMPGFYGDGEYDLVGTIVGCVEKSEILDGKAVQPGDVLLGLPSSGLHTNGYSLARKIFFDQLGLEATSRVPELANTVANELLKVHVNYAPALLEIRAKFGKALHAAVHITGGGFSGNIPRVLPEGRQARVKRGSWPALPVFKFLQRAGKVSDEEMHDVFNMGLGMILICASDKADEIARASKEAGFPSHRIGEIGEGPREQVVFV
ncbi:MAG: phosphoribosylformylglycinamidine cyclo-ligase [Verrucomicrobiae bacterium]|nr:phosphoribosylformylglycinamidine cyclo-ligase [Verrucomicrobiae bacterium]